MLKIKRIVNTCTACPSQWDAELEDGTFAYFRYRYGTLRCGIGNSEWDAVEGKLGSYVLKIGEELDGCMTYEQLISHFRDTFEFPEHEEFDDV